MIRILSRARLEPGAINYLVSATGNNPRPFLWDRFPAHPGPTILVYVSPFKINATCARCISHPSSWRLTCKVPLWSRQRPDRGRPSPARGVVDCSIVVCETHAYIALRSAGAPSSAAVPWHVQDGRKPVGFAGCNAWCRSKQRPACRRILGG